MDRKELICIICPNSCRLAVDFDENGNIEEVAGHRCKRGKTYVENEIMNPVRTLATLVHVDGGCFRMCPVKTDTPVPKQLVLEIAKAISKLEVKAPVNIGDIIVNNIMGTGSNLIATRSVEAKGNCPEL